MNIILEIDHVILAIHLVVGFSLVYFAARAFHKTKYQPMLLVVIGFSLLVVGDTLVGDLLGFLQDSSLQEWVEEAVEIAGFLVLILAIKRS